MKIFMSPVRNPKAPDIYMDLLTEGLPLHGVDVEKLPYFPRSAGISAVHLHFPEMYFRVNGKTRHPLSYSARVLGILASIHGVRRRGGRLVWTVHNLEPHVPYSGQAAWAFDRFRAAILSNLDVFISLTEGGVAEIRRVYPQLAKVPYVVARHPHYRDQVRPTSAAKALREAWSLPTGTTVVGCIGRMQRYKNLDGIARAFTAVRDDTLRLVIVGNGADENTRQAIAECAARDSRILFVEEKPLSNETLADYHAAVDIVAFNGVDNFNSGTVMMALSLSRPVIAPDSPVNAEIAALVGAPWMALFSPPLTDEGLAKAIAALRSQSRGDECPLDPFSPAKFVAQVATAYTQPLSKLAI